MGKQGFRESNNDPYVYQEITGSSSSAFGLDAADSGKWKIHINPAAGAVPQGTSQISVDPAVNGHVGITPNGTGSLDITTNTGGSIIFRGITTGGWTGAEWHTEQHVVQTTDATPTSIFEVVLAAKKMITIKAVVNGFQNDYSDVVGGEILITAYRNNAGGDITLAGAPIINVNYTSLTDTSDINADIFVGSQSIKVLVIGVVAQTWNWASTITYMYTIDNS